MKTRLPTIDWRVFIPAALALAVVELLGAAAAGRLVRQVVVTAAEPLSTGDFMLVFALGTLGILLVLRFLASRVVVSAFFYLAVFVGLLTLAEAVLPEGAAAVAALAVLALRIGYPRVVVHDLTLVASLAGMAAAVGVSVPPEALAVLLVFLAFYDIVAVYLTHHMVTMVRGLLEKGAVFALVVPDRPTGWMKPLSVAAPGAGFTLLGTGDLALPGIFVVSVAMVSPGAALISGIGSFLGILGTHLIFQSQTVRRPMAALPPIVAGTLIGYLVARLIGL